MRGLALRLGIIGVIALGAFALKPFLTGNAGDLGVGDCFDPPTTTDTVKDVQHHPCSDSHGGEVILVEKHPDASSYPTDDDFDQFVAAQCVPAFQAYTGTDLTTNKDADIGWFVPTPDGWAGGDRTVICYATRTDDQKTTGSVKKS
jgi:Septum formation